MAYSASTPRVTLASEAAFKLCQLLNRTSASGYPGTVIGVINSAGDELFLGNSEGTDANSVGLAPG